MKKAGLYFGTFNPIHIGHLVIANYMAHHTDLDEVWLVVTPHNPLKERKDLLPDEHRLQMARLATLDNNELQVSDIEFDLPQPNYTIRTLEALQEKHPGVEFSLIMGEDNLRGLHRWKEHERITKGYDILVYPRSMTEGENPYAEAPLINMERVEVCDAPLIRISSTYLRDSISRKNDIRYLVPDTVINYISNNYLYEND